MSETLAEIPPHIGFILDGNRRWAQDNGLPKLEGHRRGYDNLKTIAFAAFDRGVSFVSAYIFSTENWNREKSEVSYLMTLALKMVTKDLDELHKKGVRVVWFGTKEKLSDKLLDALHTAEETTKDNQGGTLILCFNYGGRKELAEGVKRLILDGYGADDISEELIAGYLYESGIPAVDMIVRTSGEQRISNFMLWRAAYSELLFVDKHWPAFTVDDLDAALEEYKNRHRRFGS